ncbi:hypothetical protein Tco_1481435 [Tanacetum coccineum]
MEKDKMLEENLPAPTRSEEQLVPVKACLPYGKSNLLLDLQKLQKNPIFHIYEAKTGVYRFQLDEQWFTLSSDLLRDALEITPVDPTNPFVSSLAGEIRAILSLINQCLTGKTSRNDKPRHPVLQMLWGIVTRTNMDYAELLWEEFVQGIQTFFTHRDSNKIPSKKPTPHVIPYCRFTKLIIYYLGSKYNIHMRPESPRHVTGDDFLLGNLKFVPKGKKDEVFGMPIPKELITEDIQKSEYYKQYVKMAARKVQVKEGGKKKTAPKADKPVKPTPAKQPKPVKEKISKPSPTKQSRKGKVQKVRKGKSYLKLIDEDEEVHHEPEPQGKGEDYDLNRAIQMSLETFQGKAIATDEQAAQSLLALHTPKRRSTIDQFIFQRRTPTTEEASTGSSTQLQDYASANIVCDSSSPTDAETETDTDITTSTANTEVLYAEDV